MRWSRKTYWEKRDAKKRAEQQWHKWFAWYPVEPMSNEYAWWETVERRWDIKLGWKYKFIDK